MNLHWPMHALPPPTERLEPVLPTGHSRFERTGGRQVHHDRAPLAAGRSSGSAFGGGVTLILHEVRDALGQ